MDKNIYIQAIITLFMLGALLFLIFRLFRSLVIDSYRQALFNLRDGFFDEALNGKISFSDPAYQFVRNSLNWQIRYSHQMTIWSVLGILVIYAKNKKIVDTTVDNKWHKATGHLDEETYKLVTDYYDRSSGIAARYIIGLSPEFIPILVFLVGIILIFGMFKQVKKVFAATNKTVFYAGESAHFPSMMKI